MNNMKKKILSFVLILFAILNLFSGCAYKKASNTPLRLVKVYHPPYYSLADIHNIGLQSEILPYPATSPELPLPGGEAYFRNVVIFEFNQEIAPVQRSPLFYLNGGATGLILKEGSKPRFEPFDWRYMNETFYKVEGNKIIITARIAFGMGLPVFLLPKGLLSKSGAKLENDVLVYLTDSWKPENRYWEFEPSETSVVPIPKRKGDGRKIGFTGHNNVPLLSEPAGQKIMELFAGDSIEVIGEKDDFLEVRLFRKEKETEPPEEPIKPEEVRGFIKKNFFIPLPEPLNKADYVFTESTSFEGSPYEVNIVAQTFPIGGGFVSFPADFQKLTSLTSEDIGILESYIILSIFWYADNVYIGGNGEGSNEPTTFTDPRNIYPFMLLTKDEFEVAERFREEYTNDLIKIIQDFSFPDRLKDIKEPAVEYVKKYSSFVQIAEKWVFKNKGKNEEELFRDIAELFGQDDAEKNEIYEMLSKKVYKPGASRLFNFNNALGSIYNGEIGITKTLNELTVRKLVKEYNSAFSIPIK